MLLSLRQDVWIINVDKTVYMFRLSFLILKHIVLTRGPVWFINLDQSVERFVRYFALRCGEFFCSSVWVRGLLSNYMVACAVYNSFYEESDRFNDIIDFSTKAYKNF